MDILFRIRRIPLLLTVAGIVLAVFGSRPPLVSAGWTLAAGASIAQALGISRDLGHYDARKELREQGIL